MTNDTTNAEIKILDNVFTKDGLQMQQKVLLFCPKCKDKLSEFIGQMKKK